MELGLVLVAIGAGFGALGALASSCRNRSGWEGFLFGFTLGPLGVLIAAIIPGPPAQGVAVPTAPKVEPVVEASRAIRQAAYEPRPRRLLGEVHEGPPPARRG